MPVTGLKMKAKQSRFRSLHEIYEETSSDIYTMKEVDKLSKETQDLNKMVKKNNGKESSSKPKGRRDDGLIRNNMVHKVKTSTRFIGKKLPSLTCQEAEMDEWIGNGYQIMRTLRSMERGTRKPMNDIAALDYYSSSRFFEHIMNSGNMNGSRPAATQTDESMEKGLHGKTCSSMSHVSDGTVAVDSPMPGISTTVPKEMDLMSSFGTHGGMHPPPVTAPNMNIMNNDRMLGFFRHQATNTFTFSQRSSFAPYNRQTVVRTNNRPTPLGSAHTWLLLIAFLQVYMMQHLLLVPKLSD